MRPDELRPLDIPHKSRPTRRCRGIAGRRAEPARRVFSALMLVWPLAACTNQRIGAPPREAEEGVWSIRCAALRGQDRQRRAQSCAEALKQVAGLRPEAVQVYHLGDESIVYYGWYRREYDAANPDGSFKPDALPDLQLVRDLSMIVSDRLVWPFRYATMEELPTTRSRHPEWNLASVAGYWSWHVAVFYNDATISNRKYLAEEYCRELREQGVEAYYHHGARNSSVCVGVFPKSSVQAIERKDPLTGVLSVTNRIVDERLLELQRQFPESFQNARRVSEIIRDPETGAIKQRIPTPSFLVKVPRAQEAE